MGLIWKHGSCHSCLKNAHTVEPIVLRRVVSIHDESKFIEMYTCTKCGSTRDL